MFKNNKIGYLSYLTIFTLNVIINLIFLYNIIIFDSINNMSKIILLFFSFSYTIALYKIKHFTKYYIVCIFLLIGITLQTLASYHLNNITKNNTIAFNKNKIINNVKPYSLLITLSNNNINNKETIMLLTFNPSTNLLTLLNIPSDSYLCYPCLNIQQYNINTFHNNCIKEILNNTFNIHIDYDIKINIKDFINLINNLKSDNLIQHYKNFNTNEILSLHNIIKSSNNINIQNLFLNGYYEEIYDFDYINQIGTQLVLKYYIPYQKSIIEVNKEIHNNLNNNQVMNNNIKVIRTVLMPNFEGKKVNEAVNFCEKHNITLEINYVDGPEDEIIIKQNIHEKTNIRYIDKLTIDVTKRKKELFNNNSIIDENNNNINNTDNNELDFIINEIFN